MTDESVDIAAQVAQLQEQVAFQEDAIGSLDAALSGQQQEILLLRRQIELMQSRHEALAAQYEVSSGTDVEEKPPHY